ncbi:MAG TPA: hypothetical protein VH087_05280 [Thermoanaerobaculia bacterium]|nr:hypothetical protein [Thermoanaerobaculia bacterium]
MKKLAGLLAALLLAACSTNSAGSKVPDPEVRLDQTSTMPAAAEYMTGNIPVSFRLSVTNRAAIPITLKRVDVTSVGEAGGYMVPQTTVPFNVALPPGASNSVDFTVVAVNVGNNVTGANEPVTIRVTSVYDSSEGALQTVVIRQVSGGR